MTTGCSTASATELCVLTSACLFPLLLATDRPQPSALQHQASLHDVLNREPGAESRATSINGTSQEICLLLDSFSEITWSHQVLRSLGCAKPLERRSWRKLDISGNTVLFFLLYARCLPLALPQFTKQSRRFPVLLRGKSIFLIGSCPSHVIISCKKKKPPSCAEPLCGLEGGCAGRVSEWLCVRVRGGLLLSCQMESWICSKRSDVFFFKKRS